MKIVLQTGECDIRNFATSVKELNITFEYCDTSEIICEDNLIDPYDLVLITPPLTGEVNIDEFIELIHSRSNIPVVIVADPAEIDIDVILSSSAEYIPIINNSFGSRLVATRLAYLSDDREVINLKSAWRTDMGGLSRLFKTVKEKDLSFEQILSFTLAVLTGQLGFPNGYATRIVNGELEVITVEGTPSEIKEGICGPLDEYLSVYAVRNKDVVCIEDVESDDLDEIGNKQVLGMKSYIAAPIVHDNNIFGTICVADFQSRSADIMEKQKSAIETVAHWVGSERKRAQAEKELQRQINRLENFSQIVSHDLKNPLNVIKGRYEILGNQLEESNPHIKDGLEATARMREIIESSLTYAEEGKQVNDTEKVDVSGLVSDCQKVIDTEKVEIIVVDRFNIEADRNRVSHIFENIFRNAIEHGRATTDNPVRIRIGLSDVMLTSTRQKPKGTFSFYIEDDGPGIPKSKQDSVFKLGESYSSDGTGFGLAIVKEIAESHGWDVTVTESFDGGARFEFSGVT